MAETGEVLILGASSLVGRFLLPCLQAAGQPVVALSRVPRAPLEGVRWVAGDLARPDSLAAVGRVEQVYSLSPIWLLPPALEALAELGVRRLVAFSSTSRFTKQASGSAYERGVVQALIDGEAAVEAFCAERGIGFTILRPTLIYAEGQDANVSRLAGLIRRYGVLPLPGGGQGLRQPVHADDLAALAITAMARPATDRAYDAPGGETLTYRAMATRIFEGLGRRPLILPIPLSLMQAAYAVARPLLPGSTADMVKRVGEDLTFDGSDARHDLGWTPRDFHPKF